MAKNVTFSELSKTFAPQNATVHQLSKTFAKNCYFLQLSRPEKKIPQVSQTSLKDPAQ